MKVNSYLHLKHSYLPSRHLSVALAAWRLGDMGGSGQMSDLINKRAQRNFKIASDLWDFAYAVTSHKIRRDHPEWSLSQIHEETIKRIRKGTDAGQQLPHNLSKHPQEI